MAVPVFSRIGRFSHFLSLLSLLPCGPVSALSTQEPVSSAAVAEPPAFSPQELASATLQLREHYYDRAWELAGILGEKWSLVAPEALELMAWHALSLARNGQMEAALEVAKDLQERAPDDFWSHFAMAGVLFRDSGRVSEARAASDRALALNPENLDALSLHADILRYAENEQAAVDYVDALPPGVGGHPLVQIRKAVALDALAGQSEDPEKQSAAYEFFRKVIALDTTFLEPSFFLGTRLSGAEHAEEAEALLRRSAALSLSHDVHVYLWRRIVARRDIGEEEKLALLDAAIQELWDRGGKTGGALQSAATLYEQVNRIAARDSLWAVILADYPDSPGAEWALVSRYRDLSRRIAEATREGSEVDPELRAEYRKQVESFLLRPTFHRETLRGDAYRSLLYLLREQDEIDSELLYNVVRGVELYEGINLHIIHAMAPILLAEHGVHLDYAETLARKGMVETRKQMEEYRGRNLFRTEEEFETARKNAEATMLDALGWVHFAQGRVDDAEGELLQAMGLTRQSTSVFLHLGRIYEKRHALAREEDARYGTEYLDRALDFFLKGTLVQVPGENPNDEALTTAYRERFGSLEGLEAFTSGAAVNDAEARRARILGERLEEPQAMAPFRMSTLTGDTVDSQGLAGKIVVINFWGTWCGPCVVEMPGIQEFYDQYRHDPDVVVLTLSNDENLETLRRFMEKGGYSFPVMLDEGYVSEVKVQAFPTTWFVSPDGRRVFEKRGWSDDLPQEFGWRVEALRER